MNIDYIIANKDNPAMQPFLQDFKKNTEPFLQFEPHLPKIALLSAWLPFLKNRNQHFESLAQETQQTQKSTHYYDVYIEDDYYCEDDVELNHDLDLDYIVADLKTFSDVNNVANHVALHQAYIDAYDKISQLGKYKNTIFPPKTFTLMSERLV